MNYLKGWLQIRVGLNAFKSFKDDSELVILIWSPPPVNLRVLGVLAAGKTENEAAQYDQADDEAQGVGGESGDHEGKKGSASGE